SRLPRGGTGRSRPLRGTTLERVIQSLSPSGRKKQKLYQETGKKLVSIYLQDFGRIEEVLGKKLAAFQGRKGRG
ncbi:MAG: hypothetical protein ACNA71_02960, partial [Kiritimatiellia bacterium]